MHSLPASGLKFPILRVVRTGAAPDPSAVVTWTGLCSFVRRETAQFRTFPHGTAAVMPNLGLLVRFHRQVRHKSTPQNVSTVPLWNLPRLASPKSR